MTQTRLLSLTESAANVAAGYGIAVATQLAVFPLFGIIASLRDNLGIALIFTAVSLIRSDVLRRLFNRKGRGTNK